MFEKEITFDRFVRGLVIALAIILGIYALNYLSGVLLPFFIAWFIAYLIFPIVHFFQYRLHLRSRILSILVTLTLLGGIIYGFVVLTAPSVTHEVGQFTNQASAYIEKSSRSSQVSATIQQIAEKQLRKYDVTRSSGQKALMSFLQDAGPDILNFLGETVNVIVGVVGSLIAVLYLFFILYDYEKLYNGFLRLFPPGKRKFAKTLAEDISKGMNGYFRGQFLISLCVGILFSIGFLIIGFPLAIPIGILIGVLSLIPYLHSLGLIPIVFFSLVKAASTGQNFWMILLSALVVFLCVQCIQDMILTPRIMGKAVGMPPFLILLSLSVWGYLLGIIGMIIALPTTNLIISYYKRYISKDVKVSA